MTLLDTRLALARFQKDRGVSCSRRPKRPARSIST